MGKINSTLSLPCKLSEDGHGNTDSAFFPAKAKEQQMLRDHDLASKRGGKTKHGQSSTYMLLLL